MDHLRLYRAASCRIYYKINAAICFRNILRREMECGMMGKQAEQGKLRFFSIQILRKETEVYP